MTYQDFDTEMDTDAAPWTAAPTTAQIVPVRQAPLAPAPLMVNTPATSEMMMLGSILQSVQQSQTQQMYWMREMDARLARLEHSARANAAAPVASFERGTWWAIWGLLMLILGSALVVVIVLILLNVEFR
jgi:hypothetical protein